MRGWSRALTDGSAVFVCPSDPDDHGGSAIRCLEAPTWLWEAAHTGQRAASVSGEPAGWVTWGPRIPRPYQQGSPSLLKAYCTIHAALFVAIFYPDHALSVAC